MKADGKRQLGLVGCLLVASTGGQGCGPDVESLLVSRWGWMVVADFDADGRADVLTNRLPKKHLSGTASVAMLSGAHALTLAVTPASRGYHQAGLGDVTGDGVPDLVFPRWHLHPDSGKRTGLPELVVVPGGTGPLWAEIVSGDLPPRDYSETWLLGLLDVDHDGHLDTVFWRREELLVMPGEGGGSFGTARFVALPFDNPSCTPPGGYPAAAIGDFDGDGLEDVVLACDSPPALVLVRSEAQGGFAAGWRHRMRDRAVALTLGDFDGDGRLDVATLHLPSGSGSDYPVYPEDYAQRGRLRVHTSWNAAAPSDSRTFDVGVAPVDLAAGDLDGDGVDDIVVANLLSSSFHVLLSAGGAPRMRELDLEHPASAIALGDVDDDGDLDVLLRRSVVDDAFSAEDFRGNDLFVFENRGAGELRHAGTHSFDEEDRP